MTDQVVLAAIPTARAALAALREAKTTILTGDPLGLPARVEPAFLIAFAKIQLLVPGLAGSEQGALNTDLDAKFNELDAKLAKMQAG